MGQSRNQIHVLLMYMNEHNSLPITTLYLSLYLEAPDSTKLSSERDCCGDLGFLAIWVATKEY
jgi:hypothetical protein